MIRWILGGGVCGLLGAALWAAISYLLNIEIGWIAVGVGAFVGYGVRLAARDEVGVSTGGVAVLVTVLSLLGGKYWALSLNWDKQGIDELLSFESNDEFIIANFANVIVRDRERAGQPLRWPRGRRPDAPSDEADYPVDVWHEAETRWLELSDNERAELRREPMLADEEWVISFVADDFVEDRERAGRPVEWPDGVDPDDVWMKEHYPPDIWNDSVAVWNAMSDDERSAFRAEIAEQRGVVAAELSDELFWTVFRARFGFVDVLFFAIAVGAAYSIAGIDRE